MLKMLDKKTPKGVASEVARRLKAFAEKYGYNPESIVVRDPEGTMEFWGSKAWSVCWEEGPFEWAPCLSMGSSILAGEMSRYSDEAEFAVNAPSVLAEPYNNFVLCFYRD
jgi:hypothetical protein